MLRAVIAQGKAIQDQVGGSVCNIKPVFSELDNYVEVADRSRGNSFPLFRIRSAAFGPPP